MLPSVKRDHYVSILVDHEAAKKLHHDMEPLEVVFRLAYDEYTSGSYQLPTLSHVLPLSIGLLRYKSQHILRLAAKLSGIGPLFCMSRQDRSWHR